MRFERNQVHRYICQDKAIQKHRKRCITKTEKTANANEKVTEKTKGSAVLSVYLSNLKPICIRG